jgi:hypothetical protein
VDDDLVAGVADVLFFILNVEEKSSKNVDTAIKPIPYDDHGNCDRRVTVHRKKNHEDQRRKRRRDGV